MGVITEFGPAEMWVASPQEAFGDEEWPKEMELLAHDYDELAKSMNDDYDKNVSSVYVLCGVRLKRMTVQ